MASVKEIVNDSVKPTVTKKRAQRQRLVSYRSQDSNDSQETTASRKSGPKRMAVTKMLGLILWKPTRNRKETERTLELNSKLNRSPGRGLVVFSDVLVNSNLFIDTGGAYVF